MGWMVDKKIHFDKSPLNQPVFRATRFNSLVGIAVAKCGKPQPQPVGFLTRGQPAAQFKLKTNYEEN